MFHRGWFWVDGASLGTAERMVDVVKPYGVVRTGTVEDALREIVREPLRWAGVVSEVRDAHAGPLLALRSKLPALPLLAVMSPLHCQRLLNPLQSRGVEMAIGPVDDDRLDAFVRQALTRSFHPRACVARVLAELAAETELTPREVQVLASCLGNEPREVLRRRLGISENTLKSQIKGLLRKCGERSVHELAKRVLRSALMIEDSELALVVPTRGAA
jgi:DNA-binding CsgD family transcriptional regulator